MISPDKHDSGQVLIMTAILLVVLIGCIVYVSDLGQMTAEKIALQTSSDAGATAGAAFIADSLNYLTIGNWMILAGTGASVLSLGKTAPSVAAIETMQASIIKAKAAPAHALAVMTAKATGAKYAMPWNRGDDGKFIEPELMVAQEKRLWSVFTAVSQTSGLVVVDKLKDVKGRSYGERYVVLAATLAKNRPLSLGSRVPLLDKAAPRFMTISQAAVTGGNLWFHGLKPPYPGYQSHMTAVSQKHKGNVVRH